MEELEKIVRSQSCPSCGGRLCIIRMPTRTSDGNGCEIDVPGRAICTECGDCWEFIIYFNCPECGYWENTYLEKCPHCDVSMEPYVDFQEVVESEYRGVRKWR